MIGLPWKQKRTGSFEEIAGHEIVSEPMNDIAEELNITNNMDYKKITSEDVNAKVDAEGDHLVELKYSMSDGRTVILGIDRERNSITHVFKEEDGKLVPMCLEHQLDTSKELSKEEIEKILPNDEIKDEDEDEPKTLGGDAWDRLQRIHH